MSTLIQNLSIHKINKMLAILLVFFIPLSTTLTQMTMGLILVTWLLTGNLKEKIKLAFQYPVIRAACFLFLIFLVGLIYTQASWREAFAQLEKMSKLLYFVCLVPLFYESKQRKNAIWAFIFAMMITLSLALLRVYGDIAIPTRYSGPSIFKNAIDTNLMMSLAAFLMAQACITAFQKRNKVLSFVLPITILLTIFYCLWMSSGRTGYVTFSLLWILFCLQRLPSKIALGGITVLVAGISLLILTPLSTTSQPSLQLRLKSVPIEINSYRQGEETSVGSRLHYLAQSLKLVQQRPLFGWGTGSFKTVYGSITPNTLDKNLAHSTNPHNEYLNISVQWGIVGLGGFLLLLWATFKMSLKLPMPERYLAQGVLASFMVGALANSLLMDVTPGYVFVVLVAACLGAYPIRPPHSIPLVATVDSIEKKLILQRN